jgi:preprotein translocase subunit YajC
MLTIPAYLPAQADPGFSFLIPILLMIVIFYFLLIRPQQQRAKEHRDMVSKVRRGDTVVTSGGFVGRVTKVADNSDDVEVELNEQMRIRVLKSTLMEVRSKGEPVKDQA